VVGEMGEKFKALEKLVKELKEENIALREKEETA
jgi:hypothetical protein